MRQQILRKINTNIKKEVTDMKNRKVIALRIMAFMMLALGIIGMVRGSTAATACLCGASSLTMASNRIQRNEMR